MDRLSLTVHIRYFRRALQNGHRGTDTRTNCQDVEGTSEVKSPNPGGLFILKNFLHGVPWVSMGYRQTPVDH
jgi:hypothetical protein